MLDEAIFAADALEDQPSPLEGSGDHEFGPALEAAVVSLDLTSLLPLAPQILESASTRVFRTVAISRAIRSAALCNNLISPSLHTKAQAILLGRVLIRVDSRLDLSLTRHLPLDDSGTFHERVVRALEILDAISPGNRLVAVFAGLARHKEVHIASKATLLLGKRVLNLAWAERALQSGEPRIRASVVEAFWDSGEKGSQIFRECLRDGNSRVSGNAIYGLHRSGHPRFAAELARLMHHPRPEFRITACWIIGKAAAKEYIPRLQALMKDRDLKVQEAARFALARFEAEVKAPEPTCARGFAVREPELEAPWKFAPSSAKRTFGALLQTLRALEGSRRTVLVAVDGLSRAGKSHFARRLALSGKDVIVVPTSDFGVVGSIGEAHEELMIDRGLDLWRMQEQLLEPLVAGKDARYELPQLDSAGNPTWRSIPAGGIVIIEGLYSLRQELRRVYDYRIWIDVPRNFRLSRANWQSSSEEAVLWEEQRLPKEDQYIRLHKPFETVQLVADGAGEHGVDPDLYYMPGKIKG